MTRHSNRSPLTGERYARAYPGDAEDKRAARLHVYKHAIKAPRLGHAVTLAGTEPLAEVALLRDYLHWPGERAWFVDWAKDMRSRPLVIAALRGIERAWPSANVRRQNVLEVVEQLPMIGFANLDFMGFDRTSVMPCVRMTIERLAPGGVMSITWFRGREVDEPCRSAWDVLEAARDVEDPGVRRWIGVQRLVARWAKEARVPLTWSGGIDYQHKNSPMSVTVFRRPEAS
jgi:hypothetical protein